MKERRISLLLDQILIQSGSARICAQSLGKKKGIPSIPIVKESLDFFKFIRTSSTVIWHGGIEILELVLEMN